MKKIVIVLLIMASVPTWAQEPSKQEKRDIALGYSVDLFPTVLSAVDSKFGLSFQTWVGIDRLRLRMVGAHMYKPRKMLSREFKSHEISAGALILDYMIPGTGGGSFGGLWVGTGFEIWNNKLSHSYLRKSAEWNNVVLTAGIGYTWKIAGNFYVDPYVAGHYVMNSGKVRVGVNSYRPDIFQASFGLKVGYFFDLK